MGRLGCFEGWESDQLTRLAAAAKFLSFPKKEKLIGKGDLIGSLFVVISGRIRLHIPLSNGTERVIALLGQGESLGEPCIVMSEPCPYEVVACQHSHLIAIDAPTYRRELRRNPLMVERVLSLVSKRLLNTLRDIEICAQPTSVQRVASFINQLGPNDQTPAFEICLPGLKRDIAAKLGLRQETFSRMLTFLIGRGFIKVNGAHVRVDDRGRLRRWMLSGCPLGASANK